ncbi:MAG: acetolactate synthase small subunit [Proteobacteria bacterium]|nr:acetolactate synthase small subunit [Pseudomonadota bacterium]
MRRELHTFVAHVEDRPGVLNRVTSLFRRRAYNIDSLTVGRTEIAGISRMTIVMEADAATARLVEANLYKLVNVLRVEDVTHEPTLLRDLSLIKVKANAEIRPKVMQIAEVFRARVVDVTTESLVLEITGTEDKIQGLIDVLQPFGIVEMVRTGIIAMTRGADGIPIDPGFVHARVPTNGDS